MSKLVEKIRAYSDEPYFIALDDLSFEWTYKEMAEAVAMYRAGKSLEVMAKMLRPHTVEKDRLDEVALLLMHLSRKRKIYPRVGGLFG